MLTKFFPSFRLFVTFSRKYTFFVFNNYSYFSERRIAVPHDNLLERQGRQRAARLVFRLHRRRRRLHRLALLDDTHPPPATGNQSTPELKPSSESRTFAGSDGLFRIRDDQKRPRDVLTDRTGADQQTGPLRAGVGMRTLSRAPEPLDTTGGRRVHFDRRKINVRARRPVQAGADNQQVHEVSVDTKRSVRIKQKVLKSKYLRYSRCFRPELLLESLVPPIPRNVFDSVIKYSDIQLLLATLKERQDAREVAKSGRIPSYGEMKPSLKSVRKLIICLISYLFF